MFDGEESITEAQKMVLLKSNQEYVSSEINPINPIVQSVVRKFRSTSTNEILMEQMSQGGFELMKKMLVEEVEGITEEPTMFI